MIPEKVKKTLEKQHYKIIGNHSAIQICRWTKKSIRDEGFCFKQQFYGVKSHLCCQMTPAVMWCPNKCVHCWRATELTIGDKMKGKLNSPKEIVDGCIKAQKKLLEGFKILPETKHKTVSKANMKKWEEAQEPMHFSISLSGEPTIYPKIGDLIAEIRRRGKTSFLVTNGLYPEKIKELANKKQLPTQLTVSLNSTDEKSYLKFHKSSIKNAWEKFNETLEILSGLNSRTVIRMNLVKDLNMEDKHIKEYVKLINKAKPTFVHVKGYMSVGFARQRLGYERMPTDKEMMVFVNKLVKETGLKLLDKHERSRAYVLGKNKSDMKIKNREI
ncbi:4-demethylwyosine synthase TYW1 [Candidatus Pacearchaeota archaeon]|nr:4-demethylwyosine synthase TYW1 [Candidatus Pacearchaeota archaeon]